jgi:hypothetical protein
MSSDFFQSELTWALAIACRDGRQNFSCFLCETAGVDGCCYVVMYNVKPRKKYAVALAFRIVKRHAVTWQTQL